MPGKTEPTISGELRNDYRRDGVIHVPGAVSEDWLAVIATGIEHNRRQPGTLFRDQTRAGDPGRYVFDYWAWQTIPEFGDFINNGPVKSLAAEVMDVSPVTLLMDNWFMNEAVHFRDHVPFDGQPDSQYTDIPDIDGDGSFEVTGWALDPGDCLVFDLRTLHRGPNHGHPASTMRRRYSVRFGAPDTIFSPRGSWTAEISQHLMQAGQKIDRVVKNPLCPALFPA